MLVAAAIATADLWLVAISWRSRTVLGGVAGVVGIALVVVAIGSGLTGSAAAALVVALILLIVGTALYGLGRALERLLDADPEDKS